MASVCPDGSFKQKVHAHYLRLVRDRVDAFRDMIAALSEGAQGDAKSSAGDKHETALSMMHIEQEKINAKLSENHAILGVLERIDPCTESERAALGSLVTANGFHLFLSAALPKTVIDGMTVIALSPQSPLGAALMGTVCGASFQVNGTTYLVAGIS